MVNWYRENNKNDFYNFIHSLVLVRWCAGRHTPDMLRDWWQKQPNQISRKLCQVVTLNVVKSIKFLRCSNMILFFILKGIEFWLMSSMRACMKTKGVLFINVDSAIFMSYCVLFDFFFCTMLQSVNAFRSDAVNIGVCASISCVCVCVCGLRSKSHPNPCLVAA